MNSFRVALTSAVAAAVLFSSVTAALAAPGQMTTNVNVRSGPDSSYAAIGTLRGGDLADISQCGNGWCYVQADRISGWVSSSFIAQPGQSQDPSFNFGLTIDGNGKPSVNVGVNQPQPVQPSPPRQFAQPQFPRPTQPQPLPDDDETAQACFYSGANFSGRSFCVDEGETLNALSANWNDRIRSIEVLGGATVDICSERNQVGLCQTLTRSKARLSRQIDRQISSIEIY